ncbi:MAG: hypothetical protein MUO97_08940 [Dehalococcoidia bacterium]|nr:hypothetical protein [Dehalococcoidia bacterium]
MSRLRCFNEILSDCGGKVRGASGYVGLDGVRCNNSGSDKTREEKKGDAKED